MGTSHYWGALLKPNFNITTLNYIINIFCSPLQILSNESSVIIIIIYHFLSLPLAMPGGGGSTKKICPFCQGILFCAQKICLNCKKEQPLKQWLKKKLQRFDEKREAWVVSRKKNHNIASIKDEAIVMVCIISYMTLSCRDKFIGTICDYTIMPVQGQKGFVVVIIIIIILYLLYQNKFKVQFNYQL